jgi:hypothetical protein
MVQAHRGNDLQVALRFAGVRAAAADARAAPVLGVAAKPRAEQRVVDGPLTFPASFVLASLISGLRQRLRRRRIGPSLVGPDASSEAIVRSAADAIIAVDADQRIVLFNAAAERMFGCNSAEAISGPLDRFIPERSRDAHRLHVERYARTGETARRVGTQLPVWARRGDGTEFPVEASISQTTVGNQLLLTVILRDITGRAAAAHELDLAREQLRERERRLDAIVQSAMDAIITIDAEQRIVMFNAAAEKVFGLSASQAVGRQLEQLLPQRFRASHHIYLERFARTGETSRRMAMQTALLALRANGTEFPIEASISQAIVGGQKLLTVILRDITERVRAEQEIRRASEELRMLSVGMLEVREAERTRIARELHDELGQALTALKMDVQLLSNMIPAGREDLLEHTSTMTRLLDSTMATTRRISADLRPLVLDDLGLAAAAEWLLQSLAQRSGLTYDLWIDPACGTLSEPHASALFRVMQESLTNVVRHARATRVDVRLARKGADALLTIKDNGIGMEPDAQAKPRSFGLRGIRERVLLLGGELSVAGAPGGGTTVSVRIPAPGAAVGESA